ncbi:MAG: hypothetical protein ACRC0L_01840 [Angustibacter sp.]
MPAQPEAVSTPGQILAATPGPQACWRGSWTRVDPRVDLWAQAALNRTTFALPQLHPWRLGDTKGSTRLVQWVGRADNGALGVLAVTASKADLDFSGEDEDFGLSGLGISLPSVDMPQWAGALMGLPGSWLPAMAWLPRQSRNLDDPGTQWSSESADFARRFTVHAEDLRTAANVMTPAVLAIVLDRVPVASSITVSGDALYISWPHRSRAMTDLGRVARACAAARALAEAIPSFVRSDHPDRSARLEQTLADRRRAAAEYRAQRDARGKLKDPH